MTVLEIIQNTTDFFAKHKVPSARLQIELLLAHVLKISRMQLYMQFDRPLSKEVLDMLRPMVRRRAQREPLQYILGEVDFMGLKIKVSPAALIPRPETELFVVKIMERLRDAPPACVVDVGTGSGVIALFLARQIKDLKVIGLDLSDEALALAKINHELYPEAQVHWAKSDLLAGWSERADYCVANLPYLTNDEMSALEPEVLQEPIMALSGGSDGCELIRKLIGQCRDKFKGVFLETGIAHTAIVSAELEKVGYRPEVHEDLTGRPRFVFGLHI